MEIFKEIFEKAIITQNLNIYNSALRLFLGFVIGGLIGLDREYHKQPAGLRTHILICVGATLLMLLSIYVPQTFKNFANGDPGRIAAQVVSGIGFLGAGAILKLGIDVKGLTTAASIWVVAGIGLAIGAGFYHGAIIGSMIILFSLTALDLIEKKYFHGKQLKRLQVFLKTEKIRTDDIIPVIKKFGIKIINVDISQSIEDKKVKMNFTVHMPDGINYKDLYKNISNIKGVIKVNLDFNI